jgi:hypothetical protein
VQAAPSGSGLKLPAAEELPAGELGQYAAYAELVGACWARDPAARPTFEEVVDRLRAIMQAGARRGPGGGLAWAPPRAALFTEHGGGVCMGV